MIQPFDLLPLAARLADARQWRLVGADCRPVLIGEAWVAVLFDGAGRERTLTIDDLRREAPTENPIINRSYTSC